MNVRLFLGITHDALVNLFAFNEGLQTNNKLDLAWCVWENRRICERVSLITCDILLPLSISVCHRSSKIFVFPSSLLPLVSVSYAA